MTGMEHITIETLADRSRGIDKASLPEATDPARGDHQVTKETLVRDDI